MNTAGLSSVCNGFGFRDEDLDGALLGYVKSEFCLDNLKDLQRFLRRDDPVGRHVFKQICKWNVVSRDLVPILEFHPADRNLVVNTLKVLVFLTMPVDPASDDVSQQIEYLWQLKAAVTRNVAIAAVVSLLEEPLEHLERGSFTEDEWKLVQLVLTFFRNVLAIQDILPPQKAAGSSSQFLYLHESFLELLFQENVMDLIIILIQHVDDQSGYLRQDNFLLLEILHYAFQGHEPEQIATCERSSKDREAVDTAISYLKSFMDEEEDKRRDIGLKNLECSSKFSGIFSQRAVDGSVKLVMGNPTTPCNILLKAHKIRRGPMKKIAWDAGNFLLPKQNILELLHGFLNSLLSGGYNILMQSIYEDIEKEHEVQNNDVVTFFLVTSFIISFQRHKLSVAKEPKDLADVSKDSPVHGENSGSLHDDICGPIAATMNEGMLFLVISKWRDAFENLKQTRDYRSLSSAGSLMKNMIRMLDSVLKLSLEGTNEHKTARILLYKIFYDQTDQGFCQFLLNLMRAFDTHKQPKSDLINLLEIIHVVLRLMENLQEHGTLKVSRKSRKRTKRKKTNGKNIENEGLLNVHATSNADTSIDGIEQSRSMFPETENILGANTDLEAVRSNEQCNKQHGDGLSCQNEQADLSSNEKEFEQHSRSSAISGKQCNLSFNSDEELEVGKSDPNKMTQGLHDRDYIDVDSSDDEQPQINEVDFEVSKLVSLFVSSGAIQNLCWLLKFCNNNSASTNHYIICMLQRICYDLELSPMLYQLSFLIIFYDILADKKSVKKCPDVVHFLNKLVRNMMKLMKKQPILCVEVLFRKTRKECHLINAEDMRHDLCDMKEQINSLSGASDFAHGNVPYRSLADALGDDEADIIYDLSNQRQHAPESFSDDLLSSPNKINNAEGGTDAVSRKQVSQEGSRRQKLIVFNEELETNLVNLYEMFKHDRFCNRRIAEALETHGKISPVEVSCKLKQLGLKVASRKKNQRVNGIVSCTQGLAETDSKGLVSDALHNSNSTEGNANLSPSLSKRKRVQAFSKEHEIRIEELYKEFKNHKRCSHMIAEALGISATQVTRKLKKLGLISPINKKAAELRKSYNGDSDGETLEHIKRKGNKKKETAKDDPGPEEKELHEDDPDDLLLSAILKKKKKKTSGEKSPMLTTTSHVTAAEEDSSDDLPLSAMVGNSIGKSAVVQPPKAEGKATSPQVEPALDNGLTNNDSLANLAEKQSGFAGLDTGSDHSNMEAHNDLEELADSDDDLDAATDRSIGMRRKRKMVFDDEDDD